MPPGPESLATHYSRFAVAERILLTGHSHQAWPDAGFVAQQQAWLDAAAYVDGKWAVAETQAGLVRHGFAVLLGDDERNIALGQNTHELVTRWLSALPLREKPRLVTSDGEFHSLRRQVDRLEEEGLEIVRVPARPAGDLAGRLAGAVDGRTAGVMVSSVLYETAEIVPDLAAVAAACDGAGVPFLVDAYHHLNVVPFDLGGLGLTRAFVTGGGYKYCQLGEGNAFLRVPPGTRMRPTLTGWFAEFANIEHSGPGGTAEAGGPRVAYGPGASAFCGATYDPTSHYRAAAVFAFHRQQGLTAARLHDINRRQVKLLETAFERLDLDPAVARVEPMPDERRGGFLAIRMAEAPAVGAALRARRIWTDARGDILRVGPAPYVTDAQLAEAIETIGVVVRAG